MISFANEIWQFYREENFKNSYQPIRKERAQFIRKIALILEKAGYNDKNTILQRGNFHRYNYAYLDRIKYIQPIYEELISGDIFTIEDKIQFDTTFGEKFARGIKEQNPNFENDYAKVKLEINEHLKNLPLQSWSDFQFIMHDPKLIKEVIENKNINEINDLFINKLINLSKSINKSDYWTERKYLNQSFIQTFITLEKKGEIIKLAKYADQLHQEGELTDGITEWLLNKNNKLHEISPTVYQKVKNQQSFKARIKEEMISLFPGNPKDTISPQANWLLEHITKNYDVANIQESFKNPSENFKNKLINYLNGMDRIPNANLKNIVYLYEILGEEDYFLINRKAELLEKIEYDLKVSYLFTKEANQSRLDREILSRAFNLYPQEMTTILEAEETSALKQLNKMFELSKRQEIPQDLISLYKQKFNFYLNFINQSSNQELKNKVTQALVNNYEENNRLFRYFLQDDICLDHLRKTLIKNPEVLSAINLTRQLRADNHIYNRALLDPFFNLQGDPIFDVEFPTPLASQYQYYSFVFGAEKPLEVNGRNINDAKNLIQYALGQKSNHFLMENENLIINIIRNKELLEAMYPNKQELVRKLIMLDKKSSIFPIIQNGMIHVVKENNLSAHCHRVLKNHDLSFLAPSEMLELIEHIANPLANYNKFHAEDHANNFNGNFDQFKAKLDSLVDIENASMNKGFIPSYNTLFKLIKNTELSPLEKIKLLEEYSNLIGDTPSFEKYIFYRDLNEHLKVMPTDLKKLFVQLLIDRQLDSEILNNLLIESPNFLKYYSSNFEPDRFDNPIKYIDQTFERLNDHLNINPLRLPGELPLPKELQNFNQVSFSEQITIINDLGYSYKETYLGHAIYLKNNANILSAHLLQINEAINNSKISFPPNELNKIQSQLNQLKARLNNPNILIADEIVLTELNLKISIIQDSINNTQDLRPLIKKIQSPDWKRNQLTSIERDQLNTLFKNQSVVNDILTKEEEFLLKIKLLPAQNTQIFNSLSIHFTEEEWLSFDAKTKLIYIQQLNTPEKWVNNYIQNQDKKLKGKNALNYILDGSISNSVINNFLSQPAILMNEPLINDTTKANILNQFLSKYKSIGPNDPDIIKFFKELNWLVDFPSVKVLVKNESNLIFFKKTIKEHAPELFKHITNLFPEYRLPEGSFGWEKMSLIKKCIFNAFK
ncbi:hypothetical protein N9N67_07145 [Bacteriovoracaceae bacterium]|nr:hypothetical protein [Bacteriovoracaceae bacterium]